MRRTRTCAGWACTAHGRRVGRVRCRSRRRAPERLLQQGVKAMAALPLVVDGAASGVISLLASETGFFDQEEVGVLSELAANVSFALELMAKQERIDYLALSDALTRPPNRTLFTDPLTQ